MNCKSDAQNQTLSGSILDRSLVNSSGLAFLLSACLIVFGLPGPVSAQTTVSVTDYGAHGDATTLQVSTVSNSFVVTVRSTNVLSNADIGKVVELFGVGAPTTSTNNQDLIALINAVNNGTNITLSVAPKHTTALAQGIYGTQNAQAFQACVDACVGNDTTIQVPAGNYLLLPPPQVAGYVMDSYADGKPAVIVQKGGIHFLGDSRDTTILTGSGAWQLQGQGASRGFLFWCQGPVTNAPDAPLIFENLTMDGGVAHGLQANQWFPALTTDGSGWDVTHGAVIDIGGPPFHTFKSFRSCTFTHWRGEMLKSVTSGINNDFIEVTNCVFSDGNASGFNMTFSHHITGCTFSNTLFGMEFYEGYMGTNSCFENNILTNLHKHELVIVGAETNHVIPTYTIQNNTFYVPDAFYGVLLDPARNVNILNNQFIGGNVGIGSAGAAYQGTDRNRNWLIVSNSFNNVHIAFFVDGANHGDVTDVLIATNTATGGAAFGFSFGYSTNVTLLGNIAPTLTTYGLHESGATGQYFIVDPSNVFPPFNATDSTVRTNALSYANGPGALLSTYHSNSVYYMDDTRPHQLPLAAQMVVTNVGLNARLYLSSALAGTPFVLSNQFSAALHWSGVAWHIDSVNNQPPGCNCPDPQAKKKD